MTWTAIMKTTNVLTAVGDRDVRQGKSSAAIGAGNVLVLWSEDGAPFLRHLALDPFGAAVTGERISGQAPAVRRLCLMHALSALSVIHTVLEYEVHQTVSREGFGSCCCSDYCIQRSANWRRWQQYIVENIQNDLHFLELPVVGESINWNLFNATVGDRPFAVASGDKERNHELYSIITKVIDHVLASLSRR